MFCENCGRKLIQKGKFCSRQCSATAKSKKRFSIRNNPVECAKEFWEKVDIRGPDECWEWKGAMREKNGYGKFNGGPAKHIDLPHRISVWLSTGKYPYGCIVRHSCDNKACVNPSHLLPGTAKENVNDAFERNLMPVGMQHSCAKLDDEMIRVIKSSQLTNSELAAIYNVHETTILRVRRGETWKHLNRVSIHS